MSNPSPDPRQSESSSPALAEGASPRHSSIGRAIGLGVVGLVAAVISWQAIERTGDVFRLPPELAKLGKGSIPGREEQSRIAAGNLVLSYKHAALWMGIAGVVVGGLFGFVLGMKRLSRTSILSATVGGLLFGGAFGTVAGPLAVYIGDQLQKSLNLGELIVPEYKIILMHAVTWLVIGLGVGLGSGLGTSRRHMMGSTLISGIAGALGGILYPIVANLAMPLVDPSFSIPEGDANRLVWLGLPCAIMGLALGRRG
jgi:hypothetical protein